MRFGVTRSLIRPLRPSRAFSSTPASGQWSRRMGDDQFHFMRNVLAAPSPVGLEAAMVSVLEQERTETFAESAKSWGVHRFTGNSSVVWDTAPGRDDLPSVMIVGHTDKIRMQVRHIAKDGKIYIDSDSFLPLTLIGNQVKLFARKGAGVYATLSGGTVEALGAIHFSDAAQRSGEKGVKPTQLYLELGLHGEDRDKQVERAGVQVGDSILLDRPITRGFAPDSFTGAYLDNGLGCFCAAEVARLVSHNPLPNVRCLFAFASHEEIGRFGSRVVAGVLKPDVLIAVDVNHDYEAAPNVGDKRFPPLKMGGGFTMSHGAVASSTLNGLLEEVAVASDIPFQRDVVGRDTGTDAMAGVLAAVDCAVTSVGFPIRNMHTVSETGHTGDVLAAVHVLDGLLRRLHAEKIDAQFFKDAHPRLDLAGDVVHDGCTTKEEKGEKEDKGGAGL